MVIASTIVFKIDTFLMGIGSTFLDVNLEHPFPTRLKAPRRVVMFEIQTVHSVTELPL